MIYGPLSGVNHLKKIFYGLLLLPALLTPCVAYCAHYGPTLENEHLYRIALKVRPSTNYTVQQVMVALLNKNPRAFTKQNINYLKSGYRLGIPDATEIANISAQLALEQVDEQNKIWSQGGELVEKTSKIQVASFDKKINNLINEARDGAFTPFVEIKQHLFAHPIETTMTNFTPEGNNTSLASFMEDTHQYQVQTNEQIDNLQQQTKTLEAQVNQLNEQLRTMTYHFIQLSALIKKDQSASYGNVLMNNLKEYGWSLGGCLIALTLLIYAYQKTGKTKPKKNGPLSIQEEYNFLEENIPSKLDLARAYIDMGDGTAAQSTLKEVLLRGDKDQRQTARDLLGKLNLGL